MRGKGSSRIDWGWLDRQTTVQETRYLRHVGLSDPLLVRMDGLASLGVVSTGDPS